MIFMKENNFDHLKLENQLCHRLYVASNALTRIYRPFLEKLSISYPQYVVLMALWEEDKITMGELSKRTLMDKGFLTTIVKKLEESSILKLKSDSHDKRKKVIELTKKGWGLQSKASSVPHDLLCSYDIDESFDFKSLMNLLDEVIHGTRK